MKNAILKTKYVVLALSILFTFSCSPEDGEMGPEGPAGQDGNANVTTVILRGQSLSPQSIIDFDVPQLTQDIFDKGLVYVYVDDSPSTGENSWRILPIIRFSGEKLVDLQEIKVGQIVIVNYTKTPLIVDFKIVLIEGN